MNTLHETAKAIAKANDWPWPYALGYASGQFDKENNLPCEHSIKDCDDYALGYFRGFKP